MPGINVAPDSYRWLAHRLVPTGVCVVTYAAIGSLGPAGRGITPGLDLDALAPANLGSRPVATALGPLLDRLAGLSEADGAPPAGRLDLDRVVVGGHSAGGTVALHSSDPGWVPGLKAVFAYGGHTMTATALGHGEAAVVAIPANVPVMLIAGTDDGVIAASRDRYRRDHATHDAVGAMTVVGTTAAIGPTTRSGVPFDEAIGHRRGDSLAGRAVRRRPPSLSAIPWTAPVGRAFLEPDPVVDPTVRELLGDPDRRVHGGQRGIGGRYRAGGAGHPRFGGPLGSTVMGCTPRAPANGSQKSRCEIGYIAPIFLPRFLGASREGSEDSPLGPALGS